MKARLRQMWHAVKGDGCTNSPDLFYGECCRRHDADYTLGIDETGSPLTRAEADRRLFRCMQSAGKTPILGRLLIPAIYFSAVRLFGRSHWKGSTKRREK